MERIKAGIGKSRDAQGKVFAELSHSPYVDPIDTSSDHDLNEFQVIDGFNHNEIKGDTKRNVDE
jgi:hypothetical protein